ncbi:PEP-CTERM/exosortase system-associated acyltransferase [Halochromatium glycolicum]|nr:PEP-CTERM/exosortase system-associated acyltransferase [Halochromatium glycolicum]
MNRFETILADTAFARRLHFHLRYQVFCEEAGFEDASRFPDQQERDEYDQHGVHFLVWDRLAHLWVGAMRLIPANEAAMPSEAIAGSPFVDSAEERRRSVEFSRLCVRARYGRMESGFRIGRWAPPGVERSEGELVFFRQWDHEIIQRLIYACLDWEMANGFDYTYFIINRALARMLKRFGIPLDVVGEPLEHRGVRIPHRGDVRTAYAGMRSQSVSFAEMADSAPAYIAFSELELLSGNSVSTSGATATVRQIPSEIVEAAQAQSWRGSSRTDGPPRRLGSRVA